MGAAQGTRASANTSGPDFTLAKIAGEIATSRSAPNEENLFLLPDRLSLERNSFENAIQPFDLMSRRHPLSSTEPSDLKSAVKKQIVLKAPVTCRHQAAGNFL